MRVISRDWRKASKSKDCCTQFWCVRSSRRELRGDGVFTMDSKCKQKKGKIGFLIWTGFIVNAPRGASQRHYQPVCASSQCISTRELDSVLRGSEGETINASWWSSNQIRNDAFSAPERRC